MAHVVEEIVTIKFSKLVKDSDRDAVILSEELVSNIDAIITELVSDSGIVVEVESE